MQANSLRLEKSHAVTKNTFSEKPTINYPEGFKFALKVHSCNKLLTFTQTDLTESYACAASFAHKIFRYRKVVEETWILEIQEHRIKITFT